MSGESQGQTLGEEEGGEAELAGQGMPDDVSGIRGDHSTSFRPEFLFCLLQDGEVSEPAFHLRGR